MRKWRIDYISKTDHDVAHCWVYADTIKDAKANFLNEYWDCETIIQILPL